MDQVKRASAYDLALSYIKRQGYEFHRCTSEDTYEYALHTTGPLYEGCSILGLTDAFRRVVLLANDADATEDRVQDFVICHEAAHVWMYVNMVTGWYSDDPRKPAEMPTLCSRAAEDVADIVAVKLAGNGLERAITIRYNEAIPIAERIVKELRNG